MDTTPTQPDYSASGPQQGLNTHSHNPEQDLLKRYVISMDGNAPEKPVSGTFMASYDTTAEAARNVGRLAVQFPGHKWHVFDQFLSIPVTTMSKDVI